MCIISKLVRAQSSASSLRSLFLRLVIPALVLFGLAHAEYGDVVSMGYKSRQPEGDSDPWETQWDQALRSQMPRYGQPRSVTFAPGLPNNYSPADKLSVTISFSQGQFVVPWVTVREGGGSKYLEKLVLVFVYGAGDIVRVRSKPTYGRETDTNANDRASFEIEYQWERLPEQDEQAGISVLFTVCLMVTVFLAFDICNSVGDHDDAREYRRGVSDGEWRSRR